jgi:hypothetical protein
VHAFQSAERGDHRGRPSTFRDCHDRDDRDRDRDHDHDHDRDRDHDHDRRHDRDHDRFRRAERVRGWLEHDGRRQHR